MIPYIVYQGTSTDAPFGTKEFWETVTITREYTVEAAVTYGELIDAQCGELAETTRAHVGAFATYLTDTVDKLLGQVIFRTGQAKAELWDEMLSTAKAKTRAAEGQYGSWNFDVVMNAAGFDLRFGVKQRYYFHLYYYNLGIDNHGLIVMGPGDE